MVATTWIHFKTHKISVKASITPIRAPFRRATIRCSTTHPWVDIALARVVPGICILENASYEIWLAIFVRFYDQKRREVSLG